MVSRVERGAVAEWFWTIDRIFLAAFILLLGVGFMLSFSASPPEAERLGLPDFYFVERHAAFLLPSLVIMIAASFLSPRQVRRTAVIVLAIAIVMMVAVLFLGVEVKGSRRWLTIMGLSVQPSEFMKPAFIVVCAWLFSEHSRHPEIPGNILAIILFGIVAALLVSEPDFGQTMLTGMVWGAMFFLAGIPWLYIVVLIGLAAGGFIAAYDAFPHVQGRVDRFLTGQGDTYQVDTAREAIMHGSWWGQGPGEGTIKRILPDSHTDFVFSVAAEEFGIIFCMALVLLFAFIVIRGFSQANRDRDDFGRLAISGLVLQIGLQSMINICVNLRLMPAKGMTLPFISYGGSSMCAIALTAGLLLALTRRRPETRSRGRSFFRSGASVPAE
ncbi:MAG: putative lipid II flippase FtsW [Pararhizobium sp.]